MDGYRYPSSLPCWQCDEEVSVVVEDRTETLLDGSDEIQAPYKVAVCPICGCVICDKDRPWAVVRAAKMVSRS